MPRLSAKCKTVSGPSSPASLRRMRLCITADRATPLRSRPPGGARLSHVVGLAPWLDLHSHLQLPSSDKLEGFGGL